MAEPFMTAVTVKITLPSNYAENRRGAEVSLSGSFPEGTTCEQAKTGHNALAAEALRVAQDMQNGTVAAPLTAAPALSTSSAPAPEKTVASRKQKPSEIVIGATASAPEQTTPMPASAPVVVDTPTVVSTPAAASGSPVPSLLVVEPTSSPAPATSAPAAEVPFDGPFVGAPTAEPPAPVTASSGSDAALPSIPASTGTAGVSVQSVPTTTSPSSAPVSGPVDASSPSVVAAPAGAGGDPLADDGEFKKLIGHHARRLNSLGDAQGASLVNAISAYTNGKGPQAAFVPVELRQALLDKLEAIV